MLETPVVSEAFVAFDPTMRERHRFTRHTRIVIDGFGRSANSYARAAFEYTNGTHGICSHIHSHRAIQLGVRHHVPVIVLIREPGAAIASALQYTPEIVPIHAVAAWVRYYRHVLPLIDEVVVGHFPDVIEDFAAVIDRVNARFGTDFVRYEKTDESEVAVRENVDTWTRALVPAERQEWAFARPTPSRRPAAEILARFDARARSELDRAKAVYDQVLAAARH
jgi:hypothetical protein